MRWSWMCSEPECTFAEEQPAGDAAITALLERCVEHEDTHPGHLALCEGRR